MKYRIIKQKHETKLYHFKPIMNYLCVTSVTREFLDHSAEPMIGKSLYTNQNHQLSSRYGGISAVSIQAESAGPDLIISDNSIGDMA